MKIFSCSRVRFSFLLLGLLMFFSLGAVGILRADEAGGATSVVSDATALEATPSPSLEQRVAYLEAMVHNENPAATGIAPVASPMHTGWMMLCAAMVLLMVLPGLGLFYGGLVRQKNVLSIFATCFGIAGLVTFLWWVAGYSLVFGTNFGSPFLGGSEYFFFREVSGDPNTNYACWIPQNVFSIFQLTFAIITPSLIFGATAERMKFRAVMLFTTLWMFVVYFPLAHMVWGATGLMNGLGNPHAWIKAIDFAGGTVVHMSSGWSALLLCLLLGKRLGSSREPMMPHSLVLTAAGTGVLWIGWYGFNAGSALGVDAIATNAFLVTTITTAVGALTWGAIEWLMRGKPSVLGFCSGAVGGLVVITPACGFVNATSSFFLGIAAGAIPYMACIWLKPRFKYDDALDAFGIHGIGGTVGAILTGVFASAAINANLVSETTAANGLKEALSKHLLWWEQVKACGLTLCYALFATWILIKIVEACVGFRVDPDTESQGLDISEHGEEGYTVSG